MLIFLLFLHCGNVYRCAKFHPSTDTTCFNRNTCIDTNFLTFPLMENSYKQYFVELKGSVSLRALYYSVRILLPQNRVWLYTETLLILSLHFDILMISLLRDVRCTFCRSISFLLTATHSQSSKIRGMESQSETNILVLTYFIR